jgi:sugar/nucleoside kinase (ribokinase family)
MLPTPRKGNRGNNLRLSALEPIVSRLTVSVLPDFFLDRIVSVPSLSQLFTQTKAKAAAGGGNLRGYSQKEVRGGNAANLAYGLASLSVRTNLFCVGDTLAHAAMANHPANLKVRFIPGQPGLTTALEFPFKKRKVNVMISGVGGVAKFDGRQLHHSDLAALEKSDCVALVNWSANENGNALAERVFSVHARKKRLNFLDPADLAGVEGRLKPLKRIIDQGLIDVVSVNENETRILGAFLSANRLPHHYTARDVLRAAVQLQKILRATVDVHTPIGSASASDEEQAWAPIPRLIGGAVTGAGDVWDAGDIVGHLLRFKAHDRLRLANACAYRYISSGGVRLPTLAESERFLGKRWWDDGS